MGHTATGQNGTSNLRLATGANPTGLTRHGHGQGRAASGPHAGAALLDAVRAGDHDEVKAQAQGGSGGDWCGWDRKIRPGLALATSALAL